MTKKPDTFEELLGLWDSPKALSIALDIPYVNAQSMRNRRSVNVTYWPRLIQLMAARGIVITMDDLAQMAIKRREAA